MITASAGHGNVVITWTEPDAPPGEPDTGVLARPCQGPDMPPVLTARQEEA